MNNKSGVFLTWFQNFVMLVFTQSFHAIFMVFVLKMMSAVATDSAGNFVTDRTNGILAIVSIAGAQALIKFEKIIKDMFGIGDSKYMGNLSKNFAKTAAAVGSGINMAKRTAEPFKERKAANRKKIDLERKHPDIIAAYKSGNYNSSKPASGSENAEESTNVSGATNTPEATSGVGSSGSNVSMNPNDQMAQLIAALNNNTNAVSKGNELSQEEKNNNIIKEYAEAEAKTTESIMKMFTRGTTTVAAAGVGLGATDEFTEAVTVANLVDAPLDWATDSAVERSVYKDKSKRISNEIAEQQRRLDEINKKNAKAAPAQKVDTTNLEKAIKDLKETKIAMDDKVPETLRRELASLWKDVKVEVAPSTQIRRIKNSVAYDRDKRNNVDDI